MEKLILNQQKIIQCGFWLFLLFIAAPSIADAQGEIVITFLSDFFVLPIIFVSISFLVSYFILYLIRQKRRSIEERCLFIVL